MSQLPTDFFRGPVLTELVETPKIKRGINWTLSPELLTPGPERPAGVEVKWKRYNGERKGARIVNYGSPGVMQEAPGSEWEYGTVLSMREEYLFDPRELMLLRSGEPYVRMQVEREHVKRMADFSVRFDVTRANLAASAFLTGKVHIAETPKGGIIVPGTTSIYEGRYARKVVDFASTNKTVGAYLSGTSGPTVPNFSSAGTDIPQFFRDLTQAFVETSNYMPALVTYGKNIPGYLGVTNTAMQAYWSRNQQYGSKFLDTGEVPTGLFGLQWQRGYLQYFIDESNSSTATAWLDDDTIVVTPLIDSQWYEMIEGGQMIPQGLMLTQDINSALNGLIPHWGKYSWAMIDPHTANVVQVVGDNAAPFIKNPNVHWIIKVKS